MRDADGRVRKPFAGVLMPRKSTELRGRANNAKRAFQDLANLPGITTERRGYADFQVCRGNRIVGFVEVKKSGFNRGRLKQHQLRFRLFCGRVGVPYTLWCEGDPLPDWIQGLKLK